MKAFMALLLWEMRLQMRQKVAWAALVLFFMIVVILMPFALGPEPELLRKMAAGLLWIATLLMNLLALDRLFISDARDGTLDLILTSPVRLAGIITAKLAAQIAMLMAALAVMVFPAALMLGQDMVFVMRLLASFMLGVPALVALGGIAGAITVGLNRNPALLTLLLAPFYIPVLIFAVSACDMAGQNAAQALLFMGAIDALILPATPFIIAAVLRQGQG